MDNTKLEDLKGIIFDVHKTLVDDSGFPRERIWKLLLQSGVKFNMLEYYRHYDDITKRLFNWADIDNFIKVREIHKQRLIALYQKYNVERNVEIDLEYLLHSMEECKIYSDVPKVLEKIEGRYKIGLLSNADDDDPLIDILLKKGFSFDVIVTSETVKAYKPKHLIFQRILSEMHLDKHDVILVGDSQISDILGGKTFGIKVVWLNRSEEILKENIPQPDYQISNLLQLLDIIEI